MNKLVNYSESGNPRKACSWVQGVKDRLRGRASVVSVMAGGAGEIGNPDAQVPRTVRKAASTESG